MTTEVPVRMAGEPLPAPSWWRLSFWKALSFWCPNSPSIRFRAATLRWQDNNARQPRICNCGAPGIIRIASRDLDYIGAVAPTWWRCEQHAEISLSVHWGSTGPLINQTRDTCSWRKGWIATGLVTECGCGTHVGERMH